MRDYAKYLIERFGISKEIVRKFKFVERGRSVWAFTGKIIPNKWESLGIRAFRIGKDIKPTTDFLRLIGRYATKNVVFLSNDEVNNFMRGESLKCNGKLHGYVIVRTDKFILGCGFCKDGKLISMIPKRYRFQDTWI